MECLGLCCNHRRGAPPMTAGDALLRAILEAPEDDGPRLVHQAYAAMWGWPNWAAIQLPDKEADVSYG